MRILLLSILLISSLSFAHFEFQECPSVAQSNFTIKIFSEAEPTVTITPSAPHATVTPLSANGEEHLYSVNFSTDKKGLYSINAAIAEYSIKCDVAYVTPELTVTKVPDLNLLVVLLSVLLTSIFVFSNSKKH